MAKKQEVKREYQKMSSETKPKGQKSFRHDPPLPVLLNISLSLSRVIIFLAGVITFGISLITGSSVVMAAIRGSFAMLTFGAIFWLLNYFLAYQVIETVRKDLHAAQSKADKGESTLEFQA